MLTETRKTCWKCELPKPLSEFHRHSGRKDGRQTKCKLCSSELSKEYFARVAPRRKASQKPRIDDLAQRVWNYLAEHPCVDCGDEDPVVLEFDHVRGKKKADISRLVSTRYGWATILKEILKCEVVCASCHRRRTYKRGKHRRWRASQLLLAALS